MKGNPDDSVRKKVNVFWFRRDLRLHDNHGLYEALSAKLPVIPIFIFDKNILDKLENRKDHRVSFIHNTLQELNQKLVDIGSGVKVFYGYPVDIFKELMKEHDVQHVFTNRDYEPYAQKRDEEVKKLLESSGVKFLDFKDHVLFERKEVVKDNGEPYTVFTPYKRKWFDAAKNKSHSRNIFDSYPSENHLAQFLKWDSKRILGLEEIDFEHSDIKAPSREVPQKVIKNYDKTRNFPGLEYSTSRLGVHFRFGTISIREKARKAAAINDTYLNELIWRDFYSQILYNFPFVAERSFKKKYEAIEWRNDEEEFEAWRMGKTGYPLVDAGMRELNESGYMHNRVRMLVASFLTKHLLIDWRWGEAYFAEKLFDFDLASNNGGWQWAAGCGTDAAPYFRIFNPTTQLDKFDKDRKYVRKWVKEFGSDSYPNHIVDHKMARQRCLDVYKSALDN